MYAFQTLSVGIGASLWLLLAACSGSEVDGRLGDAATPPTDTVASDVTTDLGGADAGADSVTPTDTGADTDVDTASGDTRRDVDAVVGPPPMWQAEPLGDVGVLADVVAVGPRQAYAVGGTRVLRYNGVTWTPYGDPSDADLHGVWADSTQVIVVGDGGYVGRRFHGSLTWETLDPGVPTATLHGVDARDPDDVWVVGSDSTILRWDGVDWTTEFSQSGIDLRSVWVDPQTTGVDQVFAVGTGGQLVRHNGAQWRSEQIAIGSATLTDIAGIGGTLIAVGSEATITIKTPTAATWQGQNTNDPQDRDFTAIAAKSANDIVVFGESGVVVRYDGMRWTLEPVAGPSQVANDLVAATFAPGGAAAADVWLAVGASGDGLIRSASAWVDLSTTPTVAISDIEGPSADALWAAGGGGTLLAMTPAGWVAVPTGVQTDLNAVSVAADGTVWAVGDDGVVLRRGADGVLTVVTTPVALDLFGVAVNASGVVVCGKGGTLLTVSTDGLTVGLRASGASADLRAVAYGGDGALWIAGGFGTLLRAVGDVTPTILSSGVGGSLNDLTPTATGVLVAGDNGVVLEANEQGVTLLSERPGVFLFGVAVGGSETFAAGWNGTILRRDGAAFVKEVSGTNAVLEAVWNDGTDAIAAGRQGAFLRRLTDAGSTP